MKNNESRHFVELFMIIKFKFSIIIYLLNKEFDFSNKSIEQERLYLMALI